MIDDGDDGDGEDEAVGSGGDVETVDDEVDGGEDDAAPIEDEGEPTEEGETKICITTCTADPASYEYCCDALTDETWCYEGFRKLKRAVSSTEDEPVEVETTTGSEK